MMSQSYIDEIAAEAAAEAEAEGLEPERAESVLAHFKSHGSFNIPFLGDYVPEGWERTTFEPLFVDSSGFGSDNEPALSVRQFVRKLEEYSKARDHIALGIIEAGQFQLYVATYRPDSRDFTRSGKLTTKELNKQRSK